MADKEVLSYVDAGANVVKSAVDNPNLVPKDKEVQFQDKSWAERNPHRFRLGNPSNPNPDIAAVAKERTKQTFNAARDARQEYLVKFLGQKSGEKFDAESFKEKNKYRY